MLAHDPCVLNCDPGGIHVVGILGSQRRRFSLTSSINFSMPLTLTAAARTWDLLLLGIFNSYVYYQLQCCYTVTVVHAACGFEVYERHVPSRHVPSRHVPSRHVRCVCMQGNVCIQFRQKYCTDHYKERYLSIRNTVRWLMDTETDPWRRTMII